MKRLSLHPLSASIMVNICFILILILLRDKIPPVIPLFYGKPQGEEQLAAQTSLILPPIISILFVLFNLVLTQITEDKFLKQVLVAISLVATLFSAITIIKIIFLIGSF